MSYHLSIGRPAVPLSYRIQMTSGVCRITRIDRDGNRIFPQLPCQSGYVGRNYIAPPASDYSLILGQARGHYRVETRAQVFICYRPYLWRLFSYSILPASLSFVGIVSLFLNTQTQGPATVSEPSFHFFAVDHTGDTRGFVMHRSLSLRARNWGTRLVGTALGGQVEKIVFTPFTGETPHVRFAKQPPQ